MMAEHYPQQGLTGLEDHLGALRMHSLAERAAQRKSSSNNSSSPVDHTSSPGGAGPDAGSRASAISMLKQRQGQAAQRQQMAAAAALHQQQEQAFADQEMLQQRLALQQQLQQFELLRLQALQQQQSGAHLSKNNDAAHAGHNVNEYELASAQVAAVLEQQRQQMFALQLQVHQAQLLQQQEQQQAQQQYGSASEQRQAAQASVQQNLRNRQAAQLQEQMMLQQQQQQQQYAVLQAMQEQQQLQAQQQQQQQQMLTAQIAQQQQQRRSWNVEGHRTPSAAQNNRSSTGGLRQLSGIGLPANLPVNPMQQLNQQRETTRTRERERTTSHADSAISWRSVSVRNSTPTPSIVVDDSASSTAASSSSAASVGTVSDAEEEEGDEECTANTPASSAASEEDNLASSSSTTGAGDVTTPLAKKGSGSNGSKYGHALANGGAARVPPIQLAAAPRTRAFTSEANSSTGASYSTPQHRLSSGLFGTGGSPPAGEAAQLPAVQPVRQPRGPPTEFKDLNFVARFNLKTRRDAMNRLSAARMVSSPAA